MVEKPKTSSVGCVGCLLGGPLVALGFMAVYVMLPVLLAALAIIVVVTAVATVGVVAGVCLLGDVVLLVIPSYRVRRMRLGPIMWPRRLYASLADTGEGVWAKQKKLRPARQGAAPAAPPVAAPVRPSPTTGIADELARVAQLHQSGQLSDEEFVAAKAKLLGS